MNYQKDNQNTAATDQGQSKSTEDIILSFNAFSAFAVKKTEKLVTALYMVTDCMDTDDAIKGKLRLLGVDLLSDIHMLTPLLSPLKHSPIASSLARIKEVISLVEIAAMIGFVSEMNAGIIRKEFTILGDELTKYEQRQHPATFQSSPLAKSSPAHFSLNKESLTVPLPTYTDLPSLPSRFWEEGSERSAPLGRADSYKGQIKDKRTSELSNLSTQSQASRSALTVNSPLKKNDTDGEDRATKILSLIKDKKDLPAGEAGVSIKDISYAFTDCSEKTIQRELNTLVSKGQLRKIGQKRWSRYALAAL